MTPVRLEPATLRSRVKHSTTEPLRSLGRLLCETEYNTLKIFTIPIPHVTRACEIDLGHTDLGFIGYIYKVLLWLAFLPNDLNIAHRNVVQDINFPFDLGL